VDGRDKPGHDEGESLRLISHDEDQHERLHASREKVVKLV
jgi:hypothetical protein